MVRNILSILLLGVMAGAGLYVYLTVKTGYDYGHFIPLGGLPWPIAVMAAVGLGTALLALGLLHHFCFGRRG